MVAFFENKKILGFVLWIVAIVALAGGIMSIVAGIQGDTNSLIDEDVTNTTLFGVLIGIGQIIMAFIYLAFSGAIYKGIVSNKTDILAGLIRLVGLATVIESIFELIARLTASDGDIGAAIVGAIISIVLGLLIMWIGGRVNDGKQDLGDKIIWVVLLVIMVILTVLLFLGLIGVALEFDLGLAVILLMIVAELIIYLFVIAFLLDKGVRKDMGMA